MIAQRPQFVKALTASNLVRRVLSGQSIARDVAGLDGPCPICYESYDGVARIDACQQECRHWVHSECVDGYREFCIAHKKQLDCTICRGLWVDVPLDYAPRSAGDFVNVGDIKGHEQLAAAERQRKQQYRAVMRQQARVDAPAAAPRRRTRSQIHR